MYVCGVFDNIHTYYVEVYKYVVHAVQGEVEQIAMMKPKAPTEHEDGMLEFLEDIVGSSRYKVPIELLAKRVEELNDMRSEKVLVSIICNGC